MAKYIRANLNVATPFQSEMVYGVIPFTYKGIKMFARRERGYYKISEFYSGYHLPHRNNPSIKNCIEQVESEAQRKNETLSVKFITRRRKEIHSVKINKRFLKIWESNNKIIFG